MTSEAEIAAIKERIAEEVRRLHSTLVEISHDLHAHPEVRFEEHRSAALLAEQLDEHGFAVERGVAGLPTAFVARYGQGEPRVGILAEYDALPKIGHACGHNLIATWALGAGLALRRALPDLPGTIEVIGTPAEEGGGGKVIMAEHGVFRGLEAAIMMHPRDTTYLDRGSLARTFYDVEFFGKPAHAAASPEKGINALDAMLQVFFSLSAMRQHLRPDVRIHGIITHGGDAVNVVPEYAAAQFLIRSKDQDYLNEVKQRFANICEGAALATGARLQLTEGLSYQARVCNEALVETFRDNLTALGLAYETPPSDGGVGSSDIGNVSRLVPTIHPYLKISDRGVGGHTQAFAEAAAGPVADEMIVAGATMLAWTAADVLLRPELRRRLGESFQRQLGYAPQR